MVRFQIYWNCIAYNKKSEYFNDRFAFGSLWNKHSLCVKVAR